MLAFNHKQDAIKQILKYTVFEYECEIIAI